MLKDKKQMTQTVLFQDKATIQKALELLSQGDDEAALTTFEKILPEELMGKVNAVIFSKLKPTPGIYLPSATRSKIRFLSLPYVLQNLWHSVSNGNQDACDDQALFARTKIAAIKSLVHPFRSPLERHPIHSELIFSYLDIKDLCRTSVCSSQLRDQLARANPRIWKHIAETFHLSKTYWQEYSKDAVRKNFALIGRINQTFSLIAHQQQNSPFDNFSFRALLVEHSKLPQERFVFRTSDTRKAFANHTLPTITQVVQRSPTPGHHCEYFVTCAKMLGITSSSIIEMFFAAGEKGNKRTLQSVINGLCSHTQNLSEQFSTIELVVLQGALPESFDNLLPFFQMVAHKRVMSLLSYLIEKGVKAGPFSMRAAISFNASLKLFPLLVEKAGVEPSVEDFRLLLQQYGAKNPQRESITDLIDLMDLLFSRQKFKEEATGPLRFFGIWPEMFRLAAKFSSFQLMERMLWHGIKPENSEDQQNTLSCAVANRMSLDEIALLKRYGAQPCRGTSALIQQYSPDPTIQRDLFAMLFP